MCFIQGDSGGKIGNLKGDIIGQSSYFKRLIMNGYRDTAVWIYKYKTVNGNKER